MGADLLDVKGGSVRFACDDKGLYRGIVQGTKEENAALAAFEAMSVPSSGWAAFPEYSYPAMNSSWKSYMCVVYTGYLWNRSDADVVWTFGAFIDDRARLIINDKTVLDCTAWNDLKFAQATLRPGANRFEWRLYNIEGGAVNVVAGAASYLLIAVVYGLIVLREVEYLGAIENVVMFKWRCPFHRIALLLMPCGNLA